jgi:hypothetical protein
MLNLLEDVLDYLEKIKKVVKLIIYLKSFKDLYIIYTWGWIL